jgi:hypothetical protein
MRAELQSLFDRLTEAQKPGSGMAPMLEELQRIDVRLDEITARTAEVEQSVVARKAAAAAAA